MRPQTITLLLSLVLPATADANPRAQRAAGKPAARPTNARPAQPVHVVGSGLGQTRAADQTAKPAAPVQRPTPHPAGPLFLEIGPGVAPAAPAPSLPFAERLYRSAGSVPGTAAHTFAVGAYPGPVVNPRQSGMFAAGGFSQVRFVDHPGKPGYTIVMFPDKSGVSISDKGFVTPMGGDVTAFFK